ncbi:MAG: hypothetical protein ACI4JM_01425, partial [Oscillospiraceae bacterium]
SRPTFFIKRLPKNFLERLKGGGCRPHTPISLIRATKGSAFGNRKLLKKLDQNFCLSNSHYFKN